MDPKRVGPDGGRQSRRQQDQSGTVRVSELAGYRLIATLGKGSTAKVYLALKRGPAGFTKLVVIKALRRDLINSLEHIEMFLDEARLSARLNHPNLAQTFEVGEEDGRYFIEMEYLAGQTLRSVHRRVARGAFPVALQLRVLSEVARGLHYAHQLESFDGAPLGIVHRDVTPHNIMLTYDGHVKLLDFGIAKAEGNENLTEVGMLKGKADYIAPEQVRGGPVDNRADVFALGAMAYEAVTGRSFSGGSKVPMVTRLHRRISGAEPPVREVNPNVPETLAHLIDTATALDPEQRVATAEEFADRIDAFLERTKAHVGPPVLAKLLDGPFAPDRRRLNQLVESQAYSARNESRAFGRHTAVLPVMRAGDTPTGLEFRVPESLSRAPMPSSQRLAHAHAQDSTAPPTPTGTPQAAPISAPLPSSRPSAAAPRPSRNFTQLLSTVLAGAALLAAGALWLEREGHRRREAPAQASPAVAEAPPQQPEAPPAPEPPIAQAPEPDMVRIRIQVIPRHARVQLDGSELQTPADLSLEKSDRTHVLQATAPGFMPVRRELSQSADAHLVLRLPRRPKARRAAVPSEPAPPTESPPAPPATVVEPTPEAEPPSEVDSSPSTASRESSVPTVIDVDNPYQ